MLILDAGKKDVWKQKPDWWPESTPYKAVNSSKGDFN